MLEQIRKELISEEEGWKVYDDFSTELEGFEKQDWLTFRSKLFNFQDFVMNWQKKMKDTSKHDAVTLHILK